MIELMENYFNSAWFSAMRLPESNLAINEQHSFFLFANMLGGFSRYQIVFGPDGTTVDLILLEANDAFFEMLVFSKDSIGKKGTEIFPDFMEEQAPDIRSFKSGCTSR